MSETWTPEQYHAWQETERKRTKYNARKVQADGYTFDSQAEWRRYQRLKDDAARGIITDLRVHPQYLLLEAFKLDGKTIRRMTYKADFEYRVPGESRIRVEDVKGGKATQTEAFLLKAKWFKWLYRETHRFYVVED